MRTAARRFFAAFSLAAIGMAPFGPLARAQPLQRSPALQQSMDDTRRAIELQGQQEQATRQSVLLQNQLTVLDAQIRTQQSIADVQAQMQTRQVTPVHPSPAGAAPSFDASQLVSIPDDVLAASNARVKAAAANHH